MAFEELKAKQSMMWGTGPYQNVTDTITDIHERVVDRLAPTEGVSWLDLACGTGAVAERAAEAGADVTGVDLAPALIETAKERASERGPRDRLPRRRFREPPVRGRRLRGRFLDLWSDVLARPRGERP